MLRRQLKRRYVLAFFGKLAPCLVGIEACASSHYWARQLQALGHNVCLMPPVYVKPYVKRQKNDSTDAEAICEAVSRANMRFVPTKIAGLLMSYGTALPTCSAKLASTPAVYSTAPNPQIFRCRAFANVCFWGKADILRAPVNVR